MCQSLTHGTLWQHSQTTQLYLQGKRKKAWKGRIRGMEEQQRRMKYCHTRAKILDTPLYTCYSSASILFTSSPAAAVAKYCDGHVCLSVCLRGYLPSHTRDLYHIFVHIAYGRGSVLIWQGDKTKGTS